jgi:hypothetical protein
MIIKKEEKEAAISLRKQGLSYNEILKTIPVAKSTLSVWLKDIGLATPQKQRLTEKRRAAQQKAQEACRNARITRETEIINSAKKEVGRISKREFWLIGAALYWAEGSKQKPNLVSQKVSFNNSDPNMILLFDRWVKAFLDRDKDGIIYSLYIHRTADIKRAQIFWGNLLDTKIEKVYFKNHNPKKAYRKNTQETYFGLLRIEVRRSTDLNRKIKGWTLGIIEGLKM